MLMGVVKLQTASSTIGMRCVLLIVHVWDWVAIRNMPIVDCLAVSLLLRLLTRAYTLLTTQWTQFGSMPKSTY